MADWLDVPLLNKNDISAFPFHNRLFSAAKYIDCVRCSSGTTGKPLVLPRNSFTNVETIYPNMRAKGVLNFYQPQHLVEASLIKIDIEGPYISGDLSKLEYSIQLAAKTEFEVFVGFVHIFELALPLLKKYQLLEKIKMVSLSGGQMPYGLLENLSQKYPHIRWFVEYAASESLGIVAAGEYHHGDTSVPLHPLKELYVEVLDESNQPQTSGGIGEIVLTHLVTDQKPFYLVRYKTGDLAQVSTVTNGHVDSFVVLGRKEVDYIKMPGGELRTEELNRVVKNCTKELASDFRAELIRSRSNGQIVDSLNLKIKSTLVKNEPATLQELSNSIAHTLRLAPTYTYADAVERGLCNPLQCDVVKEFESTTGKILRLKLTEK